MLVCWFVWTNHLPKWAHSNISQWWNVHADVYFSKAVKISVKGYYRVAVKESESEDDLSWIHWQHTWQLCELRTLAWQGRLRVTLVSDRQTAGCTLASVRAWHGHSYIAGIPLLAHSLTVKLSPCPYSHSSLSCTDSCMSVGIPNAICRWNHEGVDGW